MFNLIRSKWEISEDMITGEQYEGGTYDDTIVGTFNSLEEAWGAMYPRFIDDIKGIVNEEGYYEIRVLPVDESHTETYIVRMCEIVRGDRALGYYVTQLTNIF